MSTNIISHAKLLFLLLLSMTCLIEVPSSIFIRGVTAAAAAAVTKEQKQKQQNKDKSTSDILQPIKLRPSPISDKPIEKWSVLDVEYWMNYTIGYAEYSKFVRKHLIDGPTLLEMTPSDFEEHFPIENAMHVVKITAHLKLLKGLCLCGGSEGAVGSIVDFWSYFKQNNFRIWVVGTTSLFFPRLSMLYTFLFDDELYKLLVGVTVSQSSILEEAEISDTVIPTMQTVPFLHTLLYIIAMFVAPDLFIALESLRILSKNYIIIPCFIAHFVFKAYNEYIFLYLMYKGEAFPPDMPFLSKIWNFYSYTLFIPIISLVIYPIIPFYVQVICIWLLIAHTFLMIIGAICLLFGFGNVSAEESEQNKQK